MLGPCRNEPFQLRFKLAETFGIAARGLVSAVLQSGKDALALLAVIEAAPQPNALTGFSILNREVRVSFTCDSQTGFAKVARDIIPVLNDSLPRLFFKVTRDQDPRVFLCLPACVSLPGLRFGDMMRQADGLDAARIVGVGQAQFRIQFRAECIEKLARRFARRSDVQTFPGQQIHAGRDQMQVMTAARSIAVSDGEDIETTAVESGESAPLKLV